MPESLAIYAPILPEIILAVGAMALLMYGAFRPETQDEAVRIGDRIAIMRDGKMVQIGTAEDIVMNPADDYVADSSTDPSPANVATAWSPGSIQMMSVVVPVLWMSPATSPSPSRERAFASQTIARIGSPSTLRPVPVRTTCPFTLSVTSTSHKSNARQAARPSP